MKGNLSHELRVTRAENDILFADDGQKYVGMFSAHGAAWLSHGHSEIVARIENAISGSLGCSREIG